MKVSLKKGIASISSATCLKVINSFDALPGVPARFDSGNRRLKGLVSSLISTTFMIISLRFPFRLELGNGTCVFMFLQSWSNSEIELGL